MATLTRLQLIEYCLRSLGEPVIEINIDEQQVEDRIDEAIEYYRLYHYDGVEKVYLKHLVTDTDIQNGYIDIPDHIYGVTKVYPIAASTFTSNSIFNMQYQLRLHDLYDLSSTSVIYYTQVMHHLALLDHVLNGLTIYRFNRLNNKLFVDTSWQAHMEGGVYLLIECYRAMNPADAPKMYNDPWLKNYATALIKKQWARNISKFNGIALPGGVTIDGKSLYQEALVEIQQLEEDMIAKSSPLDFWMG